MSIKSEEFERDQALARQYFEDHPEAKNGVMKAYYAFHAKHFRLEPKGHNFPSGPRESECSFCGRSRGMVRYDDLPPECLNRPELRDIADVIRSEEESYFALLAKAETEVPKLVAKMGMSGETLAVLHHTHGYNPETVTHALEVTHSELAVRIKSLMPEYETAMETEKQRSRAAQKKSVVTVLQ